MVPQCLSGHVQNFRFHPDRAKVSGRMWSGSADAEVGEHRFTFQLWYHGGDSEDEGSLSPHLRLLSVDGLDAYWHVIWSHEEIWFHKEGWFENRKLAEHPIVCGWSNYAPIETGLEELEGLGFVRMNVS